jgi:enediyne biosynthesis protein E4
MADFALLDPNNLLLGAPDGHFTESAHLAGTASYKRGRGGLLVDLNGDGLLDMVVVNRWDKAELWRNVGSGTADAPAPMGHWIQARLRQEGGNRDAIGAWLEIEAGGRTQRQEHTIGGGHVSGSLGWMHMGLGAATTARLRVVWPGGEASAWTEVAADQFVVVDRTKGVRRWTAGEHL